MAYPQGINFRNTLGYVTDGANEAFVDHTSTYSYPYVTAQGNTVGFEQLPDLGSQNLYSSIDSRLAGAVFQDTEQPAINFRFDLPAPGDYAFRLAMGANFSGVDAKCLLMDTNSSLGALVDSNTSAASRWFDAGGTERTETTWPTNNALVNKTLTTTICRFRVGASAAPDSYYTGLAHAYVEALTGGPSAALTGTAMASITEADIVTGGKTIIATLTGDTFIAN